jgi:hypothetical protein
MAILSPLRGWIAFHSHPRLTPWAAFCRRSAAPSLGLLHFSRQASDDTDPEGDGLR